MASEEHVNLANTIKAIHKELRNLSQRVGAEEAWKQHLKDEETLRTYAKSMHELAENHWTNNASKEDRINWTVNFSENHFKHEELERWKQKDLRTLEAFKSKGIEVSQESSSLISSEEKLRVLDVGSSGNFFKNYERFSVLPIDISPSHESVFICDFLAVPIEDHLLTDKRNVKVLPRNHYDVVIFCLLLEYLPSSEMRIKCCEKAYETLKTEGILIIITPDSSHELKNSKQIKNWRWTLAKMGLQRIKLEKLKNLTCMSFRKCLDATITRRWADEHKDVYMEFRLEIPQDKTAAVPEQI